MKEHKVIHKPAEGRFEVHEDGAVGYVAYRIHDGALDILHTIVPMQLGNKGVGSALVRTAFDWAREQGLQPIGTCQFAYVWLQRHPEYN